MTSNVLIQLMWLWGMCLDATQWAGNKEYSNPNMFVCMDIATKAMIHQVPPEIPISLGSSESNFTYVSRSNGAEGPLQVKKKFAPCVDCDATTAGIVTLKSHIKKYGTYRGLCVYAMGNKGVNCKNNRYVNMVLKRSKRLAQKWKPLQ